MIFRAYLSQNYPFAGFEFIITLQQHEYKKVTRNSFIYIATVSIGKENSVVLGFIHPRLAFKGDKTKPVVERR